MTKTIIDSLVLELGFDTSNLEKGRRVVLDTFKKTSDGAKKTGTDIEDSSKKSGDYITRLRNNVLGLYAAFTAGRGLKEFVSDATASDAALGRFAKTVDQSAESIAQWRGAGRLMGVSAGDIDGTFSTLSSNFQQFALTGDSTLVPWFRALGMTMSDANGQMKPIGDMLLDLSRRFQDMDPAKATAFMQNMGISPGMINLILRGPDAIQKLIDKQKELAAAQAADAPAAAARQEAWNEFLSQAEAIGTMLLTTLTPALIGLTSVAKAFSAWGERHPTLVGIAFSALTAIVLALSAAITTTLVGSALASAITGFGLLIGLAKNLALGIAVLSETVLPALSEAFFGVALAIEATPIGWIITGIAGIAAAGYLLYAYWDKIAGWWKNLWGGMADDTGAGTNSIIENTQKLKNGGGSSQDQADIDYFVRQGRTRNQAIGIVANIKAESGGNAAAVGDGGRAVGLAQWHADRQATFAKWAGHGLGTATRAEQLAFINWELNNSERGAGNALSRTTTAEQAADAVSRLYERPGNVAGASTARQAIATALARAPTGNALPAQVAQDAATSASQVSHNSNIASSEVSIQNMTINTQAKDATGIARDFNGAVKRQLQTPQANYGPA